MSEDSLPVSVKPQNQTKQGTEASTTGSSSSNVEAPKPKLVPLSQVSYERRSIATITDLVKGSNGSARGGSGGAPYWKTQGQGQGQGHRQVVTQVISIKPRNDSENLFDLKEYITKKDSVYVFFNSGGSSSSSSSSPVVGKGIIFSADMTVREIVGHVVETEGLDTSLRYVLGVPELRLFFAPDEKTTPMRRIKFVQACNMVGVPPMFEILACAPGESLAGADEGEVAQTLMAHVTTLRGIGDSYVLALAAFSDEVIDARKELTLLSRRVSEVPSIIPADEAAAVKYLEAELNMAYTGTEARIREQGAPQVTVRCRCSTAANVTVEVVLSKPPSTTVHKVIEDICAAAGGGASEGLTPVELVLKVRGMNEFLVPMRLDRSLFQLGDFDYVRRCVAHGEEVCVSLVPRAVLHATPQDARDITRCKTVSRLLSRNVWRKADHPGRTLPMSSLGPYFRVVVKTARKLTLPPESLGGNVSLSPGLDSDASDSECDSNSTSINSSGGTTTTTTNSSSSNNNSNADDVFNAYVVAEMFHGGRSVASAITPIREYNSLVAEWEASLDLPISGRRIPREARICFTVYRAEPGPAVVGTTPIAVSDKHVPLGWCAFLIMDYKGRLRTGEFRLRLWEGRANPIGTCMENTTSAFSPPVITISIPQKECLVVFEGDEAIEAVVAAAKAKGAEIEEEWSIPKLRTEDVALYKATLAADSLTDLSRAAAKTMWDYREMIRKTKPRAVAKVLRAVDWTIPEMAHAAHQLLAAWDLVPPTVALELLDARFADMQVRDYAVRCLWQMSDSETAEFLIQLIQVLRYEPYHNSPLARFLLFRALKNQPRLGHMFFWHLKSNMTVPEVSERYGILLEIYLNGCSLHRQEINSELDLLSRLEAVARTVKQTPTKEARMKVIADGLAAIPFPRPVTLPLDSRFVVNGFVVEKCKYFDSKKVPLLLIFRNADPYGDPIHVIFKVGDDLRQDILTLQVMRVMDTLWKASGMDFGMQLYKCVATGDSIGMLEAVLNAETTTNIAQSFGGVISENTITDWLKRNNPERKNKCTHIFITHLNSFITFTSQRME